MSKNREYFERGCLPAAWVEVDVKENTQPEQIIPEENKTRKDLSILLAELEEIKSAFLEIEEKKNRLQNLMSFYRGELLT